MPTIALRFISGKYKGGEYILPDTGLTVIGRSSDIDLVLMEEMVSRKHAEIWFENGKINIKDLGSTNGTFVNGEKISKAVVNEGDRILIGTSIMKVIESAAPVGRQTRSGSAPPPRPMPQQEVSKTTMQGGRSMTGTITEIPLPDLIQLLSTSKKSGTLIINQGEVIGKMHLDNGKIVYSSISDSPGLNPLKSVFRILTWSNGTFELHKPEPKRFPETINMPTEHILMEGLAQLDELRNMGDNLPPMDAKLAVVNPLLSKLTDLNDEELEIFQLALNSETVQDVLDQTEAPAKDVAGLIISLISKEYITKV